MRLNEILHAKQPPADRGRRLGHMTGHTVRWLTPCASSCWGTGGQVGLCDGAGASTQQHLVKPVSSVSSHRVRHWRRSLNNTDHSPCGPYSSVKEAPSSNKHKEVHPQEAVQPESKAVGPEPSGQGQWGRGAAEVTGATKLHGRTRIWDFIPRKPAECLEHTSTGI